MKMRKIQWSFTLQFYLSLKYKAALGSTKIRKKTLKDALLQNANENIMHLHVAYMQSHACSNEWNVTALSLQQAYPLTFIHEVFTWIDTFPKSLMYFHCVWCRPGFHSNMFNHVASWGHTSSSIQSPQKVSTS